MLMIVGLGNPGAAYRASRHNVGAMVVRRVAEGAGIRLSRLVGPATAGEGRLGRQPVVLGIPRTFMNESGIAVQALLARWPVPLASLLVVCDDVALPFGALRLRPRGSDGGHRGLRSIVGALGSVEFPRLRVGIGQTPPPKALDAFVLAPFGRPEQPRLPDLLEAAAVACTVWSREGIEAAMNRYNRKVIE
ncbi:MAG: aminoacyl-tRNA hydrolase [Candidatus Omnitrophica bacterium]|nr:aminoacyl-tRNA hydrolase [Candidatus Omnitrophota bacterium]